MMLNIGTRVVADNDIIIGTNRVAAMQNEYGQVSAAGAGDNVEVTWERTGIVTVVSRSEVSVALAQPENEVHFGGDRFHTPPPPEAPPVMGWFAALAEEHIRQVLEMDNLRSSSSMRHLMIADIYARLECAAATDRNRS